MKIITSLLKIAIAVILLQTLYFKFSAHPDSVYIFTQLNLEPYGRIGIGVLELLTAVFLFKKSTEIYSMLLSIGLMSGAMYSHITKLGFVVNNDGGLLFSLALIVWIMSVSLLIIKREKIKKIISGKIMST